MELRGCSQVHFMSVIKGSKIIKMHNISRGKYVLNFRNLEEIYASDSSLNDLPSKRPPKVDRSLAMADGVNEVKSDVKIEYMEENDLEFSTITLKQLKRNCKSKKRKAPYPVKLAAVKQEDILSTCLEDEAELKETLCSWKRKVLKKSKVKKRKCATSLSFEANYSTALALFDISNSIYGPRKIKLEDPEPDFFQPPQAISYILGDDTGSPTDEVVGTREWSSLDMPHEYLVQPISVDTSKCVLNQASYEFRECTEPHDDMIPECSTIDDWIMADGSEVTNQLSVYCVPECQDLMTSNEEGTQCSSNSYAVEAPGEEISVKLRSLYLDGEAQRTHKCQPRENDNHIEEVHNSSLRKCYTTSTQENNPSDYGVGFPDNFTSMVNDAELSVDDVTSSEVQANKCENVENISNDGTQSMANNEDSEPAERSHVRDCNPPVQDDKDQLLAKSMTSLPSTTNAVEDKQSSMPGCSTAPISCIPGVRPNNAVQENEGVVESDGTENEMMLHSPERLFCTRKTISPTSQERLRKAMSSAELQDGTEIIACKEERLPQKTEVSSSTTRSDGKRTRFIISARRLKTMNPGGGQAKSQQKVREERNEKNAPPLNACVSSIDASLAPQCIRNGCSCVRMCSQNAISFSKRQMKDTERLSSKLVTGLHSMKSIVIDALQQESRTGAKSLYNNEQVRIAVESVSKVEDSAKKWLAMMTRDCNRFCKIMRLAESYAPSPEKPVPKERKIVFADEAGGKLCNVKVFKHFDIEMDVASPDSSAGAKGEGAES